MLKRIRHILAVAAERALRARVKRLIYKRLYGGRWRRVDALTVWVYRRLPNRHPLVLATLAGQ